MLVMHWDQFTQPYKDGKTINKNKTDVKCSRFHEEAKDIQVSEERARVFGGGEPGIEEPKSNKSISLVYKVFPKYSLMGGPPLVFVQYS